MHKISRDFADELMTWYDQCWQLLLYRHN